MPASTVSFEDMHLLINMSLGDTSNGEVNFKHLHTLLHEMVNKLETSGTAAAAADSSSPEQTTATEEGEEEKPSSPVTTPTPQRYKLYS